MEGDLGSGWVWIGDQPTTRDEEKTIPCHLFLSINWGCLLSAGLDSGPQVGAHPFLSASVNRGSGRGDKTNWLP